ncbi:MAG: anti-sigma factor [Rhizobiaceae bacterium]|nr:anti-sigma factor [Rhizobiaceae bacterium]MCV0404801.1 anti-sigma factor [Rhizobiaceae bacterium]
MSAADDNGRELEGDEALAAEYVLGVLSADERKEVARRVGAEPAFARLVDEWEVRLADLGAAYQPVEPPAGVTTAIDRALFASAVSPVNERSGIWTSLAFWRAAAFAAIVGLAIAIAIPLLSPAPAPVAAPERLLASLSADGSDIRYVALYDAGRGAVSLSHESGQKAAGYDFELWVIEDGDAAPVSLGVIPDGATAELSLTEEHRRHVADGGLFAISLEPAGGSPTGAPTGPVVAAGELRSL